MSPLSEARTGMGSERETQWSPTMGEWPTTVAASNDDYEPTTKSKEKEAGALQQRSLRSKKAINDDEFEASEDTIEVTSENRKRKAATPQVQIPRKKFRAPGAESASDECFVVESSFREDGEVMETTEAENFNHKSHNGAEEGISSRDGRERSQKNDDVSVAGDFVSREEHDKTREKFNTILRKHNQDKQDLRAELESAESDRDKYEAETVKLRNKLDRMSAQEDEWAALAFPRFKKWKQKEISQKVEEAKGRCEKELEKKKKAMDKRFETQERNNARMKEELKGKIEHWKSEGTDARKHYDTLEKNLKRETENKINRMRPEKTKEVKAKTQEIQALEQQVKKLQEQRDLADDQNAGLRDFAQRQKNAREELKQQVNTQGADLRHYKERYERYKDKYNGEAKEVQHLNHKLLAQQQKAQEKFDLQYQNSENMQHGRTQLQRSQFLANQQNERNNRMVRELTGKLQSQKKGFDGHVKELRAGFDKEKTDMRDEMTTMGNRITVQKVLIAFLLTRYFRSSTNHASSSSSSSSNNRAASAPPPDVDVHASPSGHVPRPEPTEQGVSADDQGGEETDSASQERSTETQDDNTQAVESTTGNDAPGEADVEIPDTIEAAEGGEKNPLQGGGENAETVNTVTPAQGSENETRPVGFDGHNDNDGDASMLDGILESAGLLHDVDAGGAVDGETTEDVQQCEQGRASDVVAGSNESGSIFG